MILTHSASDLFFQRLGNPETHDRPRDRDGFPEGVLQFVFGVDDQIANLRDAVPVHLIARVSVVIAEGQTAVRRFGLEIAESLFAHGGSPQHHRSGVRVEQVKRGVTDNT